MHLSKSLIQEKLWKCLNVCSIESFEFYSEVNDMEKWGMFEFNTPYIGEIIEKINDVVLPKDYIDFMKNTMVEKVILVKPGLYYTR